MVKIGIPLRYSHLEDDRCILYLAERVRRTIQKAGGFIIPIVQVQDVDYADTKYNEYEELTDGEKDTIEKYLDMVDGVLLPGGFKTTPYDKYLFKRCIERDIPTLGICLGMQLLSNYKRDFKVELNESSIKILGQDEIFVNSYHKYHCLENDKVISNAYSEDGYIEGVEVSNKKFVLGVQWHPEISYDFDDNSKKILDYFISVCGK